MRRRLRGGNNLEHHYIGYLLRAGTAETGRKSSENLNDLGVVEGGIVKLED